MSIDRFIENENGELEKDGKVFISASGYTLFSINTDKSSMVVDGQLVKNDTVTTSVRLTSSDLYAIYRCIKNFEKEINPGHSNFK